MLPTHLYDYKHAQSLDSVRCLYSSRLLNYRTLTFIRALLSFTIHAKLTDGFNLEQSPSGKCFRNARL